MIENEFLKKYGIPKTVKSLDIARSLMRENDLSISRYCELTLRKVDIVRLTGLSKNTVMGWAKSKDRYIFVYKAICEKCIRCLAAEYEEFYSKNSHQFKKKRIVMFYCKEDVLKELNSLENDTLLNVRGFIDGKFLEFDNIISTCDLKNSFKELDFVCAGGQGLREFYIIVKSIKYTIQIQENEIEIVEKLEFLKMCFYSKKKSLSSKQLRLYEKTKVKLFSESGKIGFSVDEAMKIALSSSK